MYKVLLVDDEPYVIEGLKTMIDWEKRGLRICGEASNGEDALQLIMTCDPDLVVTDIRMPGLDGLQLIRRTRENGNSRVKFIILSGYDDFAYIQSAMKYGISDYILKPIDDEEITAVLDRIYRRTPADDKAVPIFAADNPLGEERNRLRDELSRRLAVLANPAPESGIGGESGRSMVERGELILNQAVDEEIRFLLLEVDQYPVWMDNLEEGEILLKKEEVKTIIEESLNQRFRRHLLETEIHRFGLIVTQEMQLYHPIPEYLGNLQEVLKKRCNCSISVAISENARGLGSLQEIYQQAALAIHYKFFHGEGSVIYYKDIKNKPLNDDFCNKPLDALLDDIKNNDSAGMNDKISALFHDFARNMSAPEVIEAYLKNLLLEVIKYILHIHGDIGEISARFMKMTQKSDYGSVVTIDRLQADFLELCDYAAGYISAIGASNSKDIISAVTNYIKENYAKDISLQKLAKHFYVNPVYLGQLFKKSTGRQFSEYLHQTRIDEAKRLLRRTNMKISEIALAIGYHDPDYFVSKFKSITQVPPSTFKRDRKDTKT